MTVALIIKKRTGSAMNVLEIIKEYLIQNEYDGLYNTAGECACLVENLAPCSESCSDCEPGYRGCGGPQRLDNVLSSDS